MDNQAQASPRPRPVIAAPAGAVPTVLVVDDDPNLRALMETVLLHEGYRVLTAADVASAQRSMRAAPANLLILDLSLPGVDGFAFLGQLREEPGTRGLPVLVVSCYSEVECRESLARMGAAGFLGKPFRNRDLVAAVGRILGETHH